MISIDPGGPDQIRGEGTREAHHEGSPKGCGETGESEIFQEYRDNSEHGRVDDQNEETQGENGEGQGQ